MTSILSQLDKGHLGTLKVPSHGTLNAQSS